MVPHRAQPGFKANVSCWDVASTAETDNPEHCAQRSAVFSLVHSLRTKDMKMPFTSFFYTWTINAAQLGDAMGISCSQFYSQHIVSCSMPDCHQSVLK